MYRQSITNIFKQLETSELGLSLSEIKDRQEKFGLNVLSKSGEKSSRVKIFFDQWKSPLIIILLIAGLVSGGLGEYIDMSVILFTALMNALIGFFQEDKANQALNQLSKMVEYEAVVIRQGSKHLIKSTEIVVGDILLLDAGDKVQADGRIIECRDLLVNESSLTGESTLQKKNSKIINREVPIGDRKNMVFRGTIIANGRTKVVVTAIGKETEIGQIASLVKDTVEEKTPLQNQLGKLARIISIIVVVIAIGLFALGFFSKSAHHGFVEMFETAIAVAVAAIPEGLVISLTVILAIGMQHILHRKALVRKLVAAETLGSVSVICTDKTGTLTEGNMRLTRLLTASQDLNFEEISILKLSEKERHPDAFLALRIGVLANDGILENPDSKEEEWKMVGDTTDTAMIYAGMKAGLRQHSLEEVIPRIDEIPFDSRNKYLASLHNLDGQSEIYVKGASDKLLSKCSYYEEDGEQKKMTKAKLAWFEEKEKELTSSGLRVLLLAYKKVDKKVKKIKPTDVDNLILVGLVALSDPLRPDVKETIALAKKAGIRTIMITGDHKKTAESIGRKLNIPCEDGQIMEGRELENMNDADFALAINKVNIFARVDPKHKIRIVKALQANGEVVAMTGDGVNDAPALKGADIGVALGSGTDVAKETSDIVLLDNSFKTIVAAVEEGRGIYQNIKKIILYLLAGSFTEVLIISACIIGGLPLAVLPVQILWMNIVQETFPVLALPFDKGDKENMSDGPRKKSGSIFDKEMRVMLVVITIVSNLVLFALFLYFYKSTGDIALARTIVFIGLGIDALFYVYAIRSMRRHIWQIDFFDNKYLNFALLIAWLMLIGAVYFPPLQLLLRTVALSWQHWVIMISFGLLNVFLIEVIKGIFLSPSRTRRVRDLS